eukprot:Nk52_evm50s223 gene=Nk52_evmTU50s223
MEYIQYIFLCLAVLGLVVVERLQKSHHLEMLSQKKLRFEEDEEADQGTCGKPGCLLCTGNVNIFNRRFGELMSDRFGDGRSRVVSERLQESFPLGTGGDRRRDCVRNNDNRPQRPSVFGVSGLKSRPFPSSVPGEAMNYSEKEFQLLAKSHFGEKHFNAIMDEFRGVWERAGVRENGESAEKSLIVETSRGEGDDSYVSGRWLALYFYNQGVRNEINCHYCPKIAEAVESFAYFMGQTVFCYAFISILEPGTVIKPHYGATNIRWRIHLALQVPGHEQGKHSTEKRCFIRVDNQEEEWELGKVLVIDDSYEHSAFNNFDDKDAIRAVLIVDVYNPNLSKEEIEVLDHIFSAQ